MGITDYIWGTLASIFLVGFFLWSLRMLSFALKDKNTQWIIMWGVDAVFVGAIAVGIIYTVVTGQWGVCK